MKRKLLVGSAIVLVAGLGSAGVLFGRHLWNKETPQADETDRVARVSPLDMSPTPISLDDDSAAPAVDPFARTARRPQVIPVTQDRYADTADAIDRRDADERMPYGDHPGLAQSRDRYADDDARVPAEDPRAARPVDPFGLRDREIPVDPRRYQEQPAADEPAAEFDAQPEGRSAVYVPNDSQPFSRVSAEEKVDRYGHSVGRGEEVRQAYGVRAEDPAEPTESWQPPGRSYDDEPAETRQDEGTGRPGDPQLSGTQAPMLSIEKIAPPEIQIGKAALFAIKVRNTGGATAQGVEIHDMVPQGTQLVSTTPRADRGARGELIWDLGALRPGEEQRVEMELMPMAEGDIGSVATVHFRAEASVRTRATKPLLTMEVNAPAQIMKGDNVTLRIKLTNPGTGAATGVIISEDVPHGLKHFAGHELEFEVGTIRPGETKDLELELKAVEAGQITNVLVAEGEANLHVEVASDLEIVAPQLEVSMAGSKRRYLERNATYAISISNPGTASAKEIELVAVLPKELKFVEANNGGQFDAATHSVYWSLEELPPQEVGTVQLTTLPLRPGEAKLLIKSTAQDGLADQREEIVAIEGMAAINFQLSDVHDPIEAGGETSYEIRVTNQGSKAASNVRVVALLPRELKALSADGPVRYRVEGQRVVFEPLKQLAPKADTVFSIQVRAVEPGDLRLQVQIATDEIREPITKEESTRVFGDD